MKQCNILLTEQESHASIHQHVTRRMSKSIYKTTELHSQCNVAKKTAQLNLPYYTTTDHHVGFLDRRQGSVEGNGRLRSKICGSEVGGQWLWKAITNHQAMKDSDSVGQQPGIGQSLKPRDATVDTPLNVTANICRPELVQRQQRQHLSTDPVTAMNRPSNTEL